ncbi:MAG: hypothetical protein KKH02_00405 [Proteobacteria bacterium]|nr:hypothetical protein [Pseudomonadota bacterium]
MKTVLKKRTNGAGRRTEASVISSNGNRKPIQRVVGLLLIFGLLLGPAAAIASAGTSIFKIGSDVTIEKGQKIRNVVAIGGQITVSGAVEKNVVAIGGSVVLTKTAVVKGNVVSLGGVIVIATDAEVGGDLTEINSSNLFETLTTALNSEWEGWSWIFAVISLSIFLVILVLALLIAALLPKPVRIVSEAIHENTLKVIFCGILGLVLIAPLALLLTISVVGIALIPLEVIVVVCSVLLGFIAVGRIIGGKVLRLFKRPNPGIVLETFWGLLILWLIGWIPYIGWMVKAIAIVIGLGAVLITRFGTHQGWKVAPSLPAAGNTGGSGVPGPAPPPPSSDSPGENGDGAIP